MNTNDISLLVVGAGGTGTYFLKELSRYLSGKKKMKSMFIVDGDTIERKNLSRQAFIEEDIGRNKADVMAEVLNESFKLSWKAYSEYIFDIAQIRKIIASDTIPVIIGCVDNHGCRLLLEQYFLSQSNCLYFDAANEETAGECVFSSVIQDIIYSPCRSYYFPDILKQDIRGRDSISCEELNNAHPQHILANMTSGLQLLSAFISFYENGKAPTGYSIYDPFRFMNKSYDAEQCKWSPIHRKEVASVWKY